MKSKTTFWETKEWQEKVAKIMWLFGAINTPILAISIKEQIWWITGFSGMITACVIMIIISNNKWKKEKVDK